MITCLENCACICESLSTSACASCPFGFEDGVCDLIVLVPDLCLSFYFLRALYT